jgi:hypothetical protein
VGTWRHWPPRPQSSSLHRSELDSHRATHTGLPQLVALDEHGGASGHEECEQGHNGVDNDLQHAKLGLVGDLEEGERTAALLPPDLDLAADDHTLAEEVV